MSFLKPEKQNGKISKESKPKSKKIVQSENLLQKNALTSMTRERNYGQIIQQIQNKVNSARSTEIQNQEWTGRVSSLIFHFGKIPIGSLKILLKIYDLNRNVFFSHQLANKKQEGYQIRFIYLFIRNIVKFYQQFAFLERQRVEQIYDQFEHWLKNREEPIQQNQMSILLQMSQITWLASSKGQGRKIIQFSLLFLLKLPKIIGKRYMNKQEEAFNETYISITMKQMIKFVRKIQLIQVQIQNSILQFYYSSFQLLVQTAVNPHDDIPLFDIAALIFSSKHSQLFMKMINFAFCVLTNSLDQKKSQLLDINNEHKSLEENQNKIKATLVSSAILIFQSVLQDEHFEKKCSYQKQVLFLIILTFKQHLSKLIDQLQKIDKLSIHPSIIRGMFDIATFGNNIYDHKNLSRIVTKIRQTNEIASFLSTFDSKTANNNENSLNEVPTNKEVNENMIKMIETTLFDLLYRIQKSLATYSLQIFMDQYIEHPLTFKREYFIQNMFKNQHQQIILKFMINFTSKWLILDQRTFDYQFDYQFYLINFLNKCVKQDKIDLIGRFIKKISLDELIKINLAIYKFTFQEEKKKYVLPESQNYQIQLAHLTSVGFADKFMLINRIMSNFPEQLMWRQFVHHICPSSHHILVKAFYHVVNYEFAESTLNQDKIKTILTRFEAAIHQKLLEEVFSIFQLILCIFMKKTSAQIDRQLSKRVIKIIVQNHALLMGLFNQVYQNRRTAMNHMELTQEMVTQNLKCLQKAKRMSSHFLRSILKFFQKIQNIHLLTQIGYQKMIEIILIISKDFQYTEYHSIRQLSDYSGEKYYSNLLSTKIHQKISNKQRLPINNLLMLKEVINVHIRKYLQQPQQHYNLSIRQKEILSYYEYVLESKIQVMNERDLLKSKLIVLESIFQIKQFLLKQSNNEEYQSFRKDFKYSFNNSFKEIIIQIAQQNPDYVSKYERELILHLRVLTITQILKSYKTDYQIMDETEMHNFIFELCFDKHVQIRFLLQNVMVSRFKNDTFKLFLSEKYHIMAFTTIMAIFDTHPAIKQIASNVVESFKHAGDDQSCLGLTILLFCLKHILTYFKNSINQDKYNINIDFFLKFFDRLWLVKKEWEFFAYAFACKFIQEKRIGFIIGEINNQGYIQSYICAKERTDFIMETEIKQYLKKEWEFSFEFPPEQPIPNSKENLINKILLSLPYRIFTKLKLIIAQKPRSTRLIRNKKDLLIDWNWLNKRQLVKFHRLPLQMSDIVELSL